MTPAPWQPDKLYAMFDDLCDGALSESDAARLDGLLRDDSAARWEYLCYLDIHAGLGLIIGSQQNDNRALEFDNRGLVASATSESPVVFPIPDLSVPDLPFNIQHSYFGGVLFSYLMATLILGTALAIAGAWKLPDYSQVVQQSVPLPSPLSPLPSTVGRITGMVDCKWESSIHPSSFILHPSSPVSLGDTFALSSGLMEITYDSGAKVILQGPVTYEVESPTGGYLSVGKLTAKLEKGSEVRVQESEASNHKSKILNHKFVVRTPTATVTDLGTEFGVEVGDQGVTRTRVYVGKVAISALGGQSAGNVQQQIVEAGQSASVQNKHIELETTVSADSRHEFVRVLQSASDRYAELVLSMQPVVYYRMEQPRDEKDRLTVFDSAGGGHHGLLDFDKIGFKGAEYTPGRFGDALFFRGANVGDHVLVPDYPKTNNDQLTVSAWVMVVDRSLWPMIIGNWSATSRGHFHFGLFADAAESDLAVSIAQRNREQIYAREGPSHPFPVGQWQHVAFACDKSVLRLYRNGIEVASTPCNGLLAKPEVPFLAIGSSAADDGVTLKGGFWHGRIDELAIFNHALSAEEIRRLFQSTSNYGVKADK